MEENLHGSSAFVPQKAGSPVNFFAASGISVPSTCLYLRGDAINGRNKWGHWLFAFDEMGHAYNYFFVHNRDPRFGLRMIPTSFYMRL